MSHTLALPRPRLFKRRRRNATAVLAGDFDPRPPRDVLTSLLNGVPRYEMVEKLEDESKRAKKRERREKDKERLRAKRAEEKAQREEGDGPDDAASTFEAVLSAATITAIPTRESATPAIHIPSGRLGPSRPSINMASAQRSVSITPPPMPSSPASTPGPSISSSTSRLSSKRPHTPDDDEDLYAQTESASAPVPRPKKKRIAAKKGWKGWVEGSPPPSDKLINLDSVQVITERRTRSGRNFDA